MEDQEEKAKISKIYDQIVTKINAVDESISHFQEAKELQDLQESFSDFNMIGENRKLFYHGLVVKFSRMKQENRYIVLFSDLLIVAKCTLMNHYQVHKQLKSGEYGIRSFDDFSPKSTTVDILNLVKSFRIDLPSFKNKMALLSGFELMIKYNNISKNSIEFFQYLSIGIPKELEPTCYICNIQFSTFFHRYICNRCGHNVCKEHWKNKIEVSPTDSIHVCPLCYELTNGKPYESKLGQYQFSSTMPTNLSTRNPLLSDFT